MLVIIVNVILLLLLLLLSLFVLFNIIIIDIYYYYYYYYYCYYYYYYYIIVVVFGKLHIIILPKKEVFILYLYIFNAVFFFKCRNIHFYIHTHIYTHTHTREYTHPKYETNKTPLRRALVYLRFHLSYTLPPLEFGRVVVRYPRGNTVAMVVFPL